MFGIKVYLRNLFYFFKTYVWSSRRPALSVGAKAVIGYGTYIGKGRRINIGNEFFCGRYCHISCPAKIGDNVMLASHVALVGGDHQIDYISTTINRSGRAEMKEIVIEDNVWVGHGAILMHGVTVGSGAVIAAGSVVTKDVERNSIVGGNPAQLIRFRKFKGAV